MSHILVYTDSTFKQQRHKHGKHSMAKDKKRYEKNKAQKEDKECWIRQQKRKSCNFFKGWPILHKVHLLGMKHMTEDLEEVRGTEVRLSWETHSKKKQRQLQKP